MYHPQCLNYHSQCHCWRKYVLFWNAWPILHATHVHLLFWSDVIFLLSLALQSINIHNKTHTHSRHTQLHYTFRISRSSRESRHSCPLLTSWPRTDVADFRTRLSSALQPRFPNCRQKLLRSRHTQRASIMEGHKNKKRGEERGRKNLPFMKDYSLNNSETTRDHMVVNHIHARRESPGKLIEDRHYNWVMGSHQIFNSNMKWHYL